jgi:hypothetical protein
MKKIIVSTFVVILSALSLQSAKADPTYAVLDSSGNVTNIIVCGAACAGGTFAGQTVVLQVAANPVTNANSGGIWYGPGTTTYNNNTGAFTVIQPQPSIIISTETELNENDEEITSSVETISNALSFTYQDTVKDPNNISFSRSFADNSPATISVTRKLANLEIVESQTLTLTSRKTTQEIIAESVSAKLSLINAKIQTLIKLLGDWVK